MLKQKVKVVNQGSYVITIPKPMCQILNISAGETLEVELDLNNKQIIVKKEL